MLKPTDLRVEWGPSAPTGDLPHAWFDRMRSLPTCIASNSLRSQAEIDRITDKPPNTLYQYLGIKDDPYPEPEDACKYTLPARKADGTPLKDQIPNQKIQLFFTNPRLTAPGTKLLVTFDVKFTKAWKDAFTPKPGDDLKAWAGYKFKTWQNWYPNKIHFESRNLWGRARGPQYVSIADTRIYDFTSAQLSALGVYGNVGYHPTGEFAVPNFGTDTGGAGGWDVPWGVWLHYYRLFELGVDAAEFESWNRWRPTLPVGVPSKGGFPAWDGPIPPGLYNRFSEYVVPEGGTPVCLLDRVPGPYVPFENDGVTPAGIGKFFYEFNTSAETVVRNGDAVLYTRNLLAMLLDRNLHDDPFPLQRSTR